MGIVVSDKSVGDTSAGPFGVFDGAGPAYNMAAVTGVVQAASGEAVTVPGGSWLLKADFSRSGSDLLLSDDVDGRVVVRDFFAGDSPPNLLTEQGAVISGGLAVKLAGSLAPGQIAQAVFGDTELAPASPVGRVETAAGSVTAQHADGSRVPLAKGDPVFQGDALETGPAGSIGVVFEDDTTFSLGADGRMVIDEMVYDPADQTGSFKASLVQGVFSFVSGQVAKADPDAMVLTTPVATIGIRGTKVAGRAAAEGQQNTISLMPETDAAGNPYVGEVSVRATNSNAPPVILGQAGATVQMVSSFQPPPPVVVFTPQQIQQQFGAAINTLPPSPPPPAPSNNADNNGDSNGDSQGDGEQAAAGDAPAEGDVPVDGEQVAEGEGGPPVDGDAPIDGEGLPLADGEVPVEVASGPGEDGVPPDGGPQDGGGLPDDSGPIAAAPPPPLPPGPPPSAPIIGGGGDFFGGGGDDFFGGGGGGTDFFGGGAGTGDGGNNGPIGTGPLDGLGDFFDFINAADTNDTVDAVPVEPTSTIFKATSAQDTFAGDGQDTTYVYDQVNSGGVSVLADNGPSYPINGGAFRWAYPGNFLASVQSDDEGRTGSGSNETPGTAQSLGTFSGTSGEALTVVGWVDANNAGDIDFFSFTLDSSANTYFDIDYADDINSSSNANTGLDAIVSIFNSNEELIAYNDDYSPADPGSQSYGEYDAFIGGLSLGPGTYYAAVTSYEKFPDASMPSGISTTYLSTNGMGVSGASPDATFDDNAGESTGQYVLQIRSQVADVTYTGGTTVENIDTITDAGGTDKLVFENLDGTAIKVTAGAAGTVQFDLYDTSQDGSFSTTEIGPSGYATAMNSITADNTIETVRAFDSAFNGAYGDGAVLQNAMSLTGSETAYILAGTSSGETIIIDDTNAGDAVIFGKGGDDTLTGGLGDDILYGGTGNDTINGEAGNDTINGGTGNDTINGEAGNDTAGFSGDVSGYSLSFSSLGSTVTVTDTNATLAGDDGIDTLTGIQTLSFAGGDITLRPADTQINTYTSGLQHNADITTLSTDEYVVTWVSYGQDASGGSGVYGQVFNSDGTAKGGEFQINTETANDQEHISVAALSGGDFVAVWESMSQDTGTSEGVYGQRFNSSGALQGAEFRVNTTTTDDQEDPAVAASADGSKFTVVWESYNQDGGGGNGKGVYAKVYNADGTPSGTLGEFQVNVTTSNNESNPNVAYLSNGTFVVAWESSPLTGSTNDNLFGRIFNADGSASGNEFQIDKTNDTYDQDSIDIAALTGGGFVAVWESNGQDGSLEGVYGQLFNADGTTNANNPLFRVNTTTSGDQEDVSVTAFSDGGFLVAWEQTDGDSRGVFAQRYDSSGSESGSEFEINNTTASTQDDVVLTALSDDSVVGVFESLYADGSSNGIFGQLFNDINLTGSSGNEALTLTSVVSSGTVDLGAGTDSLTLANGANTVTVSNTETITGGSGNDTITADGATAVTIDGGAGNDTLTGGSGSDTFVYGATSEFGDTITDLNAGGTADSIDFSVTLSRGTSAYFQSLGSSGGAIDSETAVVAFSDAVTNYQTASDVATALGNLSGVSTDNILLFAVGDGTDSRLWYWNDTSAGGGNGDGTIDSGELSAVADLTGVDQTTLTDANFDGFSAVPGG